ncbi:MAG: uroporphyrinogen-III synthase [Reyranella sp.]|uniref:uroporphyrinogen-III synthase n=1 Tax=Reyranella sp. TaxID=1929291 RepID=UPI001ACEF834|nr:uroporphyrinogen-III synthase [Reyranella sp.]MBN9087704.1 uroporphyrinogen-III synthase [Reyranella sp.]
MRVLITRPEREAANLAQALRGRRHEPVIAPLFRLQMLHPPEGFAATLAAAQAILVTSANGARALAEATATRSKPILAVGDTTAATAEGLGFTHVTSASGDAAALADLVRQRLEPEAGPLLHVSGADVADTPAPEGFEVQRVVLYEAHEAEALPESARAALEARAVDVATFFSPRAARLFARLVIEAKLTETCRPVTAIAISPAAAQPLADLPFARAVAAERPTRQSVLDEIDRLPPPGVQSPEPLEPMTDASAPPHAPTEPKTVDATVVPTPAPARGLGVVGAFVIGLVAAAIVLAAAVLSLPYWPQEARTLWRGPIAPPPASLPAPVMDTAALDAAKRELGARLDDLDRRVRAAAAAAAQAGQTTSQPAPALAPAVPDPAITELRRKLEALENRPIPEADTSSLKSEIVALRAALQSLDQAVAGQKASVDKAAEAAQASVSGEQKAIAAARGSAVIGIAARISAALTAGQPFTQDLALLQPLAQGDARGDTKLTELIGVLQPHAKGVTSRAALAAAFPAMAKRAMADDLADDSFWQRLLGKLKSVVSLRRTGDVPGDSVEAKLARAEAAINAGDIAKAVELVKSLPPQTSRATADWLARAEAHLAAQRAVDQLAAQAVALLGSAR